MPTKHRLGVGLIRLEDRIVPDAFGVAWPDPGHLTLSFTPDGTSTPAGPSSLSGKMSGAAATSVWQDEVLRAFQTWAVNANINIGLVKDGGQAIGTQGAVQGDSRFGDLRIAAAPIDSNEVGSASPFSWTGTTFSGDVFFNSNAPLSVGGSGGSYDIYSVAVHEAGHALGLDHSTEPGSVMQPGYGKHAGLSTGDIANIQALYGARTPDPYDARGGNNTPGQAAAMGLNGLTEYEADGDVSTNADADYYKFSVLPLTGIGGVTVRLKASGLSLLAPSVSVYDSAGRVVGTGSSTDPLNNDVMIRFSTPLLGGNYTVKVTGARSDVFGIGDYKLVVDLLAGSIVPPLISTVQGVVNDLHSNDLIGTALDLLPLTTAKTDARFDATYRGAIEDRFDVDWYRVQAPTGNDSDNLNVIVWGLDTTPLDPTIHLTDANGNPVGFQVLANDCGLMSVRVPNVTPGGTFYIEVGARNPKGTAATGGYFLGADFNNFDAPGYDGIAQNALAPAAQDTGNLSVSEGGIFQFSLAGALLQTGGGALSLTVTNSTGQVVLSLNTAGGLANATRIGYLQAGSYTMQYTYQSVSGTSSGALQYDLFLLQISDGIGPYGSGTSGSGTVGSSGGSSGYTYSGSTSTSKPSGTTYYF